MLLSSAVAAVTYYIYPTCVTPAGTSAHCRLSLRRIPPRNPIGDVYPECILNRGLSPRVCEWALKCVLLIIYLALSLYRVCFLLSFCFHIPLFISCKLIGGKVVFVNCPLIHLFLLFSGWRPVVVCWCHGGGAPPLFRLLWLGDLGFLYLGGTSSCTKSSFTCLAPSHYLVSSECSKRLF